MPGDCPLNRCGFSFQLLVSRNLTDFGHQMVMKMKMFMEKCDIVWIVGLLI